MKVSITESKVHGRRMFNVDIEYVEGDSKLGLPMNLANVTNTRPLHTRPPL